MRSGSDRQSEAEFDELAEILSRCYEATSRDGTVTVRVDAEGRLLNAEVCNPEDAYDLSSSATESVQRSLDVARDETARAMADLPGLNPQLRALLMGGL
ncbi:hypothetical protein HMPREF1531_00057 [Propionibacterium sp. oral taxon 192 str. F0372]|uniref:YbaB/EbfC family nucleoid-associated protein n=1 Tax=Propionibacterium sp. oral taxon 192 TaxID=671222 RepID=UPI00035432F2|nr:YbaB/EbfC family nucleoid-associated protein [Propionibacterium sp. oral taxon 192]EPH07012.1 hypothetical protein HMPREF1531_00057 [Propionibacterium sp. oral taxon 192 str. F0372]